jgi:DNA-binding SARP family transcriptional activator
MLRVRLLGAFALESDGVALPMPERRRACALLAWLALHPGVHPRSEVAGRFWPDVLDSSARKSLRTELVAVRRALGSAGEGVLVATRDTLGLVGDDLYVDAREFRATHAGWAVRRGRRSVPRRAAAGTRREWVYEARESHRHRLGDVLARLASKAEADGAMEDAIRISRHGVELDPLREEAHREHIRRLIVAGEVAAARRAFDDLARRLRTELQVPPARQARDARDGRFGAARWKRPGCLPCPAIASVSADRIDAPESSRAVISAWLLDCRRTDSLGSLVRGSGGPTRPVCGRWLGLRGSRQGHILRGSSARQSEYLTVRKPRPRRRVVSHERGGVCEACSVWRWWSCFWRLAGK